MRGRHDLREIRCILLEQPVTSHQHGAHMNAQEAPQTVVAGIRGGLVLAWIPPYRIGHQLGGQRVDLRFAQTWRAQMRRRSSTARCSCNSASDSR
jgi:hypothetical protein